MIQITIQMMMAKIRVLTQMILRIQTMIVMIVAIATTVTIATTEMIVEIEEIVEIVEIVMIAAIATIASVIVEIVKSAKFKSLKTMFYFQLVAYSIFSIAMHLFAPADTWQARTMYMFHSNKFVVTDFVRVMYSLVPFANHVKVSARKSSTHLFASRQLMAQIQKLQRNALSFQSSYLCIRKSAYALKPNQTFLQLA